MAEFIKANDVYTFHTQKESGILDVGTVFQQAITLTTPSLKEGKYVIGYSFELNFNTQKNQPAIHQLLGTFGSVNEFCDSIGDNDTGLKNRTYMFPKDWVGGPITLGLNFKKSGSFSQQLDINFIDVVVRYVGRVNGT